MSKILSITYQLLQFLQRDNLDIFSAMTKIEHVERTISEWFTAMPKRRLPKLAFCHQFNGGLFQWRVVTQQFRNNVEASTPREYYRRVVFVPYLDEILMHLKDKFSKHKNILLGLECLLPQNAVRKQFIDIERTIEFYKDYLQDTNRSILEAEWRLWKMSCRTPEHQTQATKKMTVCELLKIIDKDSFPNMAILLMILAVIPVKTAFVERSFSTLKRLKTCLRNKTGEERLIALIPMTVHTYVKVHVEDIVKQYGQIYRRLPLS
ncbi:hypothetical protein PR048_012062 [Dryococelus australis]|uniref:HAT C-terminal dimerisation domain-containing protein n=1 Tax=Dryococelus australis TaxID=614101 RepID=A0ABQ9HNA0_9NEOP|nr:hypothetical protein PR048_012062 [Dryococelus australis]